MAQRFPAPGRGFLALGTPIGNPAFVQAATTARLDAERSLLAELLQLPDIQSAWILLYLLRCPGHLLRMLPLSMSTAFARGHDDTIWRASQRRFFRPGPTLCLFCIRAGLRSLRNIRQTCCEASRVRPLAGSRTSRH